MIAVLVILAAICIGWNIFYTDHFPKPRYEIVEGPSSDGKYNDDSM